MMGGDDRKFLTKLNNSLSFYRSYKQPKKLGAPEFVVAHYAGEVSYNVDGFIEKNKDQVSDNIQAALSSSKQNLLKTLFPPQEKSAKSNIKGNSLSNQFRA